MNTQAVIFLIVSFLFLSPWSNVTFANAKINGTSAVDEKKAAEGNRPAEIKKKLKEAKKRIKPARPDEISSRLDTTLEDILVSLKTRLHNIWTYEIWVIDEHPMTVKKILFALLILIIGILAAKYIIRIFSRRLLSRTQLHLNTSLAIEKIIFYFAIAMVLLFSLRIMNIPLTAFAFLGGAIAIGVGFGAQNLINNFISGFIIMAERPIRVGDMIEIEQNFAIVEAIGARCTRIRTGANVHILVPNSSFLEKNITNWTLSDQKIRTRVTAGVNYGSPVRDVERRMIKAVKEHGKVISNPEPFVLFSDFGDNALIFDVYFWLSMTMIMEHRIIESDIRFRMDELFREAGIVVAFPQRDVHLDTQRPLELKITGCGGRHGIMPSLT
ncbi:MAG: mechanosensitive ion channel [Thermodesulfobacteriota bacterium]|nr:mechanosensitive ion channel [Thermodesulfobacteriota bacterium]